MSRRATRSASRAARRAEAVATGPLGALSHDELGVIFDGLADPLEPIVAVALSSTCLGLRTPLRVGLEVLKERHARAAALCRRMHQHRSCALLRDAEVLNWCIKILTADDMATLGMILRTNGLPRLRGELFLSANEIGDAGMQALCEGLGRGAAPSLRTLDICNNKFGPAGAEALAAALGRGAMPRLESLNLSGNPIGSQGVTELAAPLRKLPALNVLTLGFCDIGDDGVASLVANLGKDDFKALKVLQLYDNKITDAGWAKLLTALDSGALPALKEVSLLVGLPDAIRARAQAALSRRDAQPGA